MDVHLDANGNAAAREHAAVSLSVPAQARGPQLAVKGRPFTSLEGLVGGEFTPFRPVIHLRLEDADRPGEEVTQYDPPITIRVRYTAKDVKGAGNRDPVLGFWDGTQWVRFKAKHQFRLEPSGKGGSGGFGVVTLSGWVDPPVAWG